MLFDEQKDSLEILKALYEIYKKYPNDEFIIQRVGKISSLLRDYPAHFWALSNLLESPHSDFDYTGCIESDIKRLSLLRIDEEERLAREKVNGERWKQGFCQEGYKILANYMISRNQPVQPTGVTVIIGREGASEEIKISTGIEKFKDELSFTLKPLFLEIKDQPTHANMQLVADKLPPRIGEYHLQDVRVLDGATWLS